MRTDTTILDQMKAVITANYPELLPLFNSKSRVSNFAALKGLWVKLCQTQDMLLDQHTADVAADIAANRAGTLSWYVKIAKEFRYGQQARPDEYGDFYKGQTYTASSNIVKLVAVRTSGEANKDLVMKVMKQDSAGVASPLTSDELNAFKTYLELAKIAGVKMDVDSLAINEVKFSVHIYHDRQVIDDFGRSLTDQTKYPLKDAAKAYALSLPAGGSFFVNAFVDYLLDQPGVVNVRLVTPEYKNGSGVWTAFDANTLRYDPPSGFLVLTDATWAHSPN